MGKRGVGVGPSKGVEEALKVRVGKGERVESNGGEGLGRGEKEAFIEEVEEGQGSEDGEALVEGVEEGQERVDGEALAEAVGVVDRESVELGDWEGVMVGVLVPAPPSPPSPKGETLGTPGVGVNEGTRVALPPMGVRVAFPGGDPEMVGDKLSVPEARPDREGGWEGKGLAETLPEFVGG